MILVLLALADDLAATLNRAREATRVEIACRQTADPDEIVVCRRREADRLYRPAFVMPDPRDDVPRERSALLAPKFRECGRVGPFFTDCGFVGATMTSGNGRGTQLKTRKLAP